MRVYQFRHVGTDTATTTILLQTKTPQSETITAHRLLLLLRITAPVEWCPRRDSNPHTSRHMDLNHARLPIPPRGHLTNICYHSQQTSFGAHGGTRTPTPRGTWT